MLTDYPKAIELLQQFEGFTPAARWDVNAYRLGFGSDTRGAREIPVRRGDTTTRKEAIENLNIRLPKFEAAIIRQVGAPAYERLPNHVRIALLSIAYNYGRLPLGVADGVREAVPFAVLAARVRALGHANGGINRERREKEAALIAGGPFG
jgi:GH24 family phage-related lysozyme (muramidase)